jgi:radical SAM protein with 4Fe4S-binding SPASM domain
MKKNIEPVNILKKAKVDLEEVLKNELTKKYGERFTKYRENYLSYILNSKNDYSFSPDYPVTVLLELLNRCNLDCIMCDQGFRNDINKVVMTDEMLDKLFDDFKENKLQALMLSVSEPLLYKNIERVLLRAEDAEIMDVFLFTNGVLLTPKNASMILNSSVTRLFISIDAATQETYSGVRPRAWMQKEDKNRLLDLEANVKNFITMRDAQHKVLPLVRVSFVAIEENKHEVDDFIEKWVDIVDSVEIQEEVSIKVYDKIRRKDAVESVEKQEGYSYKCNEPWGQITVYSNGQVGPCCNAVGNQLNVGNILNGTIKEIWNDKAMRKIRYGFETGNPNSICKLCLENSSSEIFNTIKN